MRLLITICYLLLFLNVNAQHKEIVKITYYYETGRKTADGTCTKTIVNHSCALSPDLLKKYPFGSIVIYNDKKYIVHDKTSNKLRRTVDILISKDNKTIKTKNNVKLKIIKHEKR